MLETLHTLPWYELTLDEFLEAYAGLASEEDGRIGYPAVLTYRVLEGPWLDRETPVPPIHAPKPEGRANGKREFTMGAAYLPIIHNQTTYERLERLGFWHSPRHAGAPSELIDNRGSKQ
jgi:hypothetical protein